MRGGGRPAHPPPPPGTGARRRVALQPPCRPSAAAAAAADDDNDSQASFTPPPLSYFDLGLVPLIAARRPAHLGTLAHTVDVNGKDVPVEVLKNVIENGFRGVVLVRPIGLDAAALHLRLEVRFNRHAPRAQKGEEAARGLWF